MHLLELELPYVPKLLVKWELLASDLLLVVLNQLLFRQMLQLDKLSKLKLLLRKYEKRFNLHLNKYLRLKLYLEQG
jgi:hypothetical protein|uniref:Uncharacterized protein n=1 Tax=Picea glauca TaxID=3330 RepID=A0A101LUT1_PICGL|nr:hypothetical protein ABT39_MTgene2315 [Picea glauca]QHR89292.1 hypothetical protein Q903MT_gene3313 [Picea sitchensis]